MHFAARRIVFNLLIFQLGRRGAFESDGASDITGACDLQGNNHRYNTKQTGFFIHKNHQFPQKKSDERTIRDFVAQVICESFHKLGKGIMRVNGRDYWRLTAKENPNS
jgi:hypothetical protein